MSNGRKSLPENLFISSTLREHSDKRSSYDDDSKSFHSKHIDKNHNASASSKDSKSTSGLNSGTPCIFTAFTPSGKPSAISTSKDVAKRKHLISEKFVNDSKPSLSLSNKSKKEFNSGTPCISKAFTPLGKSPAIRTIKEKDSLGKPIDESKSSSSNGTTLNTNPQSAIMYYTSLKKPSVISTVKLIEPIPNKTTDESKSLALKSVTTVTMHQNVSLRKSSATAINSVDFIPRTGSHNSKPPLFKSVSTEAIHQNAIKYHIPSKKPLQVSTQNIKSETTQREAFERSATVSKPHLLSPTISSTVSQDFVRKYNIPRKSYPSESLPDNRRNFDDNKHQGATSRLGHLSFLRKYNTPRKSYPSETFSSDLRGFDGKKFQNPGSSHIPPKSNNHGSTTVDLLRCIICIEKERDTVFQPCGHLIVCNNCAKNMESTCPICRKRIKKKIKAYIN